MLNMRPRRDMAKLGRSALVRGLTGMVAVAALAAVVVPGGAFAGPRDHHASAGNRGHASPVTGRGNGSPVGNHGHGRPVARPDRRNVYQELNLISDIAGVARITDPNLVNPWGMAAGPTTPLWVADNGADVSTLYSGGLRGSIPQISPLVVNIPSGAPTGIVFNSTSGFPVTSGGTTAPSAFIFDSEAGVISAWTRTTPLQTQVQAMITTPDAVYKGLAIAQGSQGPLIYASNFHAGTIDVFDQNFKPVTMPGAFTDPNIPAGFVPFNIEELAGELYVTYAKQDADRHDDVAGPGTDSSTCTTTTATCCND